MTTPPNEKAKPEADPLAEQIGKEIERARTIKKLSVSELHRQTGISRTVLQGYEAGRYKPGARELRLLAKALDVSPTKLLFGRESFREPGPLDDMLGAPDKVLNASKLAIIFSALSREEQQAVLVLTSLLAEARMGGRDKLAEVLRAADALLDAAPEFLENIEAAMPSGVAQRIEQYLGNPMPSAATGPPRKRTRQSTKPGK